MRRLASKPAWLPLLLDAEGAPVRRRTPINKVTIKYYSDIIHNNKQNTTYKVIFEQMAPKIIFHQTNNHLNNPKIKELRPGTMKHHSEMASSPQGQNMSQTGFD